MLTELAAPTFAQEALDDAARHLKLPLPLDADAAREVEEALRASVAHIEARLSLSLVERDFLWHGRLDRQGAVTAPIGPVSAILGVDRVAKDGTVTAGDLSAFSLDRTTLRTWICSRVCYADPLEIRFTAGFGPDWSDTPADLRRAALLLTAHFYDNRHATDVTGADPLPHGVASLIGPWRPVRLGFGGV